MATVYITENGVQVHKRGQRLLVQRGKDVLQDIPLIKVDRLVLMGRGVSITTPTLFALATQSIDVLFLNSRGGYVLRMLGREHKNSKLRHAQSLSISDPARALKISLAIVSAKITNQRVLVQRHAEGGMWAKSALEQMDAMRRQAQGCKTLDELRGHEGLAAKEYFSLMRRLLKPPRDAQTWKFERREYYPPTDPVNALLSFGYTMLLNDLITACQVAGLDPDLGFFHGIGYGKPSMALDLEEEFRPVIVDSLVLLAVNRPMFGVKDFEVGERGGEKEEGGRMKEKENRNEKGLILQEGEQKGKKGIYLNAEARKRFISLYEDRVNEQVVHPASGDRLTYRKIFLVQAYSMASAILGETPGYTPFTIR